MKYLEIDGVRVSAIGLGTWQFGSREWGYGDAYAAHQAPALVRRALELGVTLIDTAEMYAFGESERIVARGLAAAGPDLAAGAFVATKLLPILPLPSIVASRAAGSPRRHDRRQRQDEQQLGGDERAGREIRARSREAARA